MIVYTIIATIIVSLISLIGVFFADIKKIMGITKYFIALAAGALIGDVFFHILPETSKEGFTTTHGVIMVGAILFYFCLEGVIRWHHSHSIADMEHHEKHPSHLGILSLSGDGVHNFIDGIAISASFAISFEIGLITTIAIIFHEIPQEIGKFGILIHSGFSKSKSLFYNFLSSLTAFGGIFLYSLLSQSFDEVGEKLAIFSAGALLYVALADMIPEVHENNHRSLDYVTFGFFLLGILLIGSLVFIEPLLGL
jgi:zinc and cadmium transporter